MNTTTATTTKPVSRLAALYGAPTPIRTSNVTRWNSEYFRAEVKCPTCGVWQRKEHNSFCYYCNIWLVEQPAPATVVTPEPVQVEQVQEVTTPEPAVVAENATEAEPGPAVEPAALRPVRPEQKAYFVKFVLNSDQSKKYAMLFRKSDGLAVGCECKSRKFHRGVACKHMKSHNAMLAPAKKQQQEAA